MYFPFHEDTTTNPHKASTMSGITVRRCGDSLVAIKQATETEARARLHREAELLAQCDHPGVVRFVDFTEGPPTVLKTAFVGPDSWRTTPATPAGLAALTATVADLHESGLTHGNLRADHVLIDAEQRPILCGFGDGEPATEERIQADRVALARMLRASTHDDAPGSSTLHDAAHALEEPALPTRAAIRLLDDLRTPTARRSLTRRTPPLGRQRVGAAVALLLVFLVAAVTFARSPERPTTASSLLRDGTASPTPAAPPTTSPPSTTLPSRPPEDQGATVVVHGGRRYGVGSAGDLVHVADWRCAGMATPAVLRPSTGEVAVFTEWPPPGAIMRPHVQVVVEGALSFGIDNSPCPALRIRTANGSQLIEVPA